MPQGIFPRPTPEERFWAKVRKTETCWLWTDAPSTYGYGRLWVVDRKVFAHRFAYELLVGPIPEGMTIDHVKANGCFSTLCVKAIADEYGPAHLEPVTNRENVLRDFPSQWRRELTHCKRGHPFDEANTYIAQRPGRAPTRECRACKVARRNG